MKILSAKIVLKNGRVVKSKSVVKDNETKKNFQEYLKKGLANEATGNVHIGRLVVRFEDISAFWLR